MRRVPTAPVEPRRPGSTTGCRHGGRRRSERSRGRRVVRRGVYCSRRGRCGVVCCHLSLRGKPVVGVVPGSRTYADRSPDATFGDAIVDSALAQLHCSSAGFAPSATTQMKCESPRTNRCLTIARPLRRRRAARGSASCARRRPFRRPARSSRRGGPSPRPASLAGAIRRCCAVGRSHRWRSCSAVSSPNVTSVQSMSLSMVLGTPTTGTPSSESQLRGGERAFAPDRNQRVDAVVVEGLLDLVADRRAACRGWSVRCRAWCRPS